MHMTNNSRKFDQTPPKERGRVRSALSAAAAADMTVETSAKER